MYRFSDLLYIPHTTCIDFEILYTRYIILSLYHSRKPIFIFVGNIEIWLRTLRVLTT